MPLQYHRSDELPAWVATISVNGSTYDYSTGWTFTVTLSDGSTTALTKTTNITGAASGVVTVAWAENDLDIAPGRYKVLLTATRTADSLEWTISDTLEILGS